MTFASMAQLRTRTWPTEESAIAELKRNGFKPRGEDYEIREHKPGSWQIMEPDDAVQPEPAEKPATVKPATTPKKAAKAPVAKKAAGKQHAADARADDQVRAAIAAATGFNVHFRLSPTKRFDEPAATLSEADAIAKRLNEEHKKSGRRAMIYALGADKAPHVPVTPALLAELLGSPSPAQPKPETPALPANDLTPLPTEAGPYAYRIEIGPQFKLAENAFDISRRIKMPVQIIDKAGKVVRTIDGQLGRGRRSAAPRKSGGGGRASGGGKQAKAIALLEREQGATAAELNKATDWPIAQRHINRLAKVSGRSIEKLGEKKWRLLPAKA